jgi:hypothetical protein
MTMLAVPDKLSYVAGSCPFQSQQCKRLYAFQTIVFHKIGYISVSKSIVHHYAPALAIRWSVLVWLKSTIKQA